MRTTYLTIWPVNTLHVNVPEKVRSETKTVASEPGTEPETDHTEISSGWPDTRRTFIEAGYKCNLSKTRQMLCRLNNCLNGLLSLLLLFWVLRA